MDRNTTRYLMDVNHYLHLFILSLERLNENISEDVKPDIASEIDKSLPEGYSFSISKEGVGQLTCPLGDKKT